MHKNTKKYPFQAIIMEALWTMSNRDADSFLLNNKILSDVKFVFPNCQHEEIFAHTFLLSKKSPVFFTMFHGSLKEGSTVKIVDSLRLSFLELLKFIYTEMVDLTLENVLEVMYLANKYLIKKLPEKCAEFIENNISIENTLSILKGSIYFKCELIEEKCVDFIKKNTDKVMGDRNFLQTDEETVRYLLTLNKMNCIEITVFNLVIKWAEAYCARKNNDLSSLRDLFRLIRFPVMSATDFTDCIKYSKLFKPNEIGIILSHISTTRSESTNTESKLAVNKCLDFETKKRILIYQYSNDVVDIYGQKKVDMYSNVIGCYHKTKHLNPICGYIQLHFLQNCILSKFAMIVCFYEGKLENTVSKIVCRVKKKIKK